MYSSLDAVDEKRLTTNSQYSIRFGVSFRYLKVVDRSNGYFVSAYITPGNILFISSSSKLSLTYANMCFLLLHQVENEEKIRRFFQEVNQLYIRVFNYYSSKLINSV